MCIRDSTYEFRPKTGLEVPPETDDDYEFICFGGEDESREFGHDLRRRLTIDVLPALRDAEGDLSNWSRSPLRPLIEDAARTLGVQALEEIGQKIAEATAGLIEFDEMRALEELIGRQFVSMSGERQDIKPRLGFNPTDPTRRTGAAELVGTTWPVTSQSNSMRIAASCCLTDGADTLSCSSSI